MPSERSDGDLVRDIAARGDGARLAEAELCRRYAPRIRLYGLKHLRDEERARDLVQVVLMATLEAARAGRIEDLEHVERFVLGTCRNASARVRRVEGRATPTDTSELDVAAVDPAADVARLDVGALFPCIAQLDARLRTVVFLSFNEERPAEEIARTLGTTAANVRVLRHRAIGRLRACLEGEHAGSEVQT